MLKHLHIRNFAVIEELEVSFDSGMTVFTGETGAGKSIIVDALGLVLGDRAENNIIRSHCEQAEISAIFAINDNPVISGLLVAQDIEHDNELMLRRVIKRDGPSRGYANGSPVPAQLLRELGEAMVDIHGQHAHQSLQKRDAQRQLLDEFGQHQEALQPVRQHYDEWQAATVELEQLTGSGQDREARLALLRYQVEELETLDPQEEELQELEEQHTRLANTQRLLETSQLVLNNLSGENQSLLTQLHQSQHALQDVLRYDPGLSGSIELLDGAGIQINEAVDELRHYQDSLELDPEKLQTVEERLSSFNDIARKHHIHPRELAGHLITLKEELSGLEGSEERVRELTTQLEQSLADYRAASKQLHDRRVKTAKKLDKEITAQLKELGMPGGQFEIELDFNEGETPRRDGEDRVEYRVSLNPGQALQPLSKVASGGELSRISLAIQVIANRDKGQPTLIFDEVDAGIGGGVAEIVGNLLRRLADKRQVFCVTHLPQVASLGHNHLLVNKSTHAKTTLTRVTVLDRKERIEEIARMLGGLKITDQSRKHAEEMINTHKL